jgi:hypothetical protein
MQVHPLKSGCSEPVSGVTVGVKTSFMLLIQAYGKIDLNQYIKVES